MTDDAERGRGQRRRNVLLGVALLARGRAAGFAEFADTREAFLTSLAPLIAFPLVGAGFVLASGRPAMAAADFLFTLCALLAPAVLSHALAQRWQREALWLRFAIAFNWCQWAIPVVGALLLAGMALMITFGLPADLAGAAALGGLAGYALWLHWFLARNGLQIGPRAAALLVVVVNLGTGLLILLPRLLAAALAGPRPA